MSAKSVTPHLVRAVSPFLTSASRRRLNFTPGQVVAISCLPLLYSLSYRELPFGEYGRRQQNKRVVFRFLENTKVQPFYPLIKTGSNLLRLSHFSGGSRVVAQPSHNEQLARDCSRLSSRQ